MQSAAVAENRSLRLAALLAALARAAGLAVFTVLGVEAVLSGDAACRTVFAITLGIAIGFRISSVASTV
jgi:hypothetical protein